MQEIYTSRMKKDIKLIKKQKKNKQALFDIIELLKRGKSLPSKYKDHPLIGNYKGCRECHIEPDWLLIYKLEDSALYLMRTGSHSELFNEEYTDKPTKTIAQLNEELASVLNDSVG